uniref:ShKT domain-containing protein n=1 Tax=Panagrolaimus sp. JU765 TaxID=591449 RepID=A0AC34QSZ6_9BILA
MRWHLLALFAVFSLTDGLVKDLENSFKLLRIWPKTFEELQVIRALYNSSSEFEFDFWKAPTAVGAFVDVMLGPESVNPTKRLLEEQGIEYRVTVEDVQKRIIEKESGDSDAGKFKADFSNPLLASFFSKRAKDAPFMSRNKAKYRFGEYQSYDEMIRWLEDIERFYPNMAKVFTIGKTHENRDIKGIKIGNPIHRTDKRAIWVDGGIHAREWAAIHTALYFIEQLIAGYNFDPQITAYVDNLNFYILPVANPDGFEYSRSDVTPQTRFWRKNRGGIVCQKDRWRRERCCGGIDLNRNFDFHFGESGSSNDICSDIYQGKSAFSEPESRAIRDKIQSPELWGKLDAYLSLHTYSQMWIHPWNHARRSFPSDIEDLQDVGMKGVEAIESVYGTKFRFGTGADILYPSSGGSDDWAKAQGVKFGTGADILYPSSGGSDDWAKAQGVKYVYLLELRPGEEQWDGFLLDRKQLIPTSRETWEGVKVVIDAVMRKAQPATTTRRTTIATTTTPAPVVVTRPVVFRQFPQQHQIPDGSLRSNLHERLNRLRQQQLKARRDYEARIAQQRQMPMCMDRSQWCEAWISSAPNICSTSTIYMQKDCARSCGFCH